MADWHDLLSTIPIFSFLGRNELAAVQELFVEETHQKGDVICRQGDEGDTFYVVLDGELDVLVGEGAGHVIAVLKRGDFFGEMALLQGGKRTATVAVGRRARLLSLHRAAFNSLFLKSPKALEYFTRILCKRLADMNKGEVMRGSTLTISVGSSAGFKGKTMIATFLADYLHEITGQDVLRVSVHVSPTAAEGVVGELLSDSYEDGAHEVLETDAGGISVLHIPARTNLSVPFYAERASNLISNLSAQFPIIVFDLNHDVTGLLDSVPLFSDVFIDIVERPHPAGPDQKNAGKAGLRKFEVINLFNPGSYPISLNHCEPFVIPRDAGMIHREASEYLMSNRRAPAALPVQRLARKILGASVGIALGGGAAFGIAHLGVLKVLEENNIPIDLIAGCSQGSLIGIGYAAGIGIDEMIDMAHTLGRRQNALMAIDPTLTKPGLLAGNKFAEIFRPLLGNKTSFEDLILPCRTVATDVESGERVWLGAGSLIDAFRASASVPMVFSPIKIDGRVLVDGGVSDPVPAEMINMMGADLCVAVNVVPPLRKGVENAVSKAFRVMRWFNPLSWIENSSGLPNMFDIIMNAMQTLQYELGNFKAISADVLINPELSDFTWIEYYRSEELIQRGIQAAEQALPAIQRAYAQKLAPWIKRAPQALPQAPQPEIKASVAAAAESAA
ncbi:MAG TPA: patatin-like phospholipase family protein [Bryobacteraceae bacterium]|nr:patatin-like phospholipase family protein [Bryobacteraceae bacterium]